MKKSFYDGRWWPELITRATNVDKRRWNGSRWYWKRWILCNFDSNSLWICSKWESNPWVILKFHISQEIGYSRSCTIFIFSVNLVITFCILKFYNFRLSTHPKSPKFQFLPEEFFLFLLFQTRYLLSLWITSTLNSLLLFILILHTQEKIQKSFPVFQFSSYSDDSLTATDDCSGDILRNQKWNKLRCIVCSNGEVLLSNVGAIEE